MRIVCYAKLNLDLRCAIYVLQRNEMYLRFSDNICFLLQRVLGTDGFMSTTRMSSHRSPDKTELKILIIELNYFEF